MGVVNKQGLVGVVKDVSEHFSTVLPIINLKFTASAELQRTGNFGLLRWDGKDFRYSYLNDVPRHADVQIGDTIMTRGSSAIYPRGINVGTVSDIEAKEGTNFHKIRVELFNDFSEIRYVYVVENLLKDEQREIEATTEDGQ